MADEPKPSWWKSIPGTLTAATGFIAALSGLVAGINQLGVFRRESSATQVVGTAPAPTPTPAESTATKPPAPATNGGSSTAPAPTPVAPVPSDPSPGASPRPASPSKPAPPPAQHPTPAPAPAVDTSAATPLRLPKGTSLELVVPSRTCAPESGLDRFTARLAGPVKVDGATVLPANTTAVLRLRRGGSPPAPQVRLDSLVGRDLALGAPSAEVRVRRSAVNGMCLRANARITATLGTTLTWRRPPAAR